MRVDVITDFWKPARRQRMVEAMRVDDLREGCHITFGVLPQNRISQQQLEITTINTYQFGSELLTSFQLALKGESVASLIIAGSKGDQYLALSRRLNEEEKANLFQSHALQQIIDAPDAPKITVDHHLLSLKGWLVSSYKREIQGLKGRFYEGDYRAAPPMQNEGSEFTYSLLVSDSNEHLIEIEKHEDHRIEVFATIYRRMADVVEVDYPLPGTIAKPVLANAGELSAPAILPPVNHALVVKSVEPDYPVFTGFVEDANETEATEAAVSDVQKDTQDITVNSSILENEESEPMQPVQQNPENENVQKPRFAPSFASSSPAGENKGEIKTMVQSAEIPPANEALECELRVANRLIEEAVNNEMRLSDVVRRVIELPLASQESVQIPITLSHDDFALLAIRYGLNAQDKQAIKERIIEDLNHFSAGGKR